MEQWIICLFVFGRAADTCQLFATWFWNVLELVQAPTAEAFVLADIIYLQAP
jgi:hypothetical protein